MARHRICHNHDKNGTLYAYTSNSGLEEPQPFFHGMLREELRMSLNYRNTEDCVSSSVCMVTDKIFFTRPEN